MIAFLVDTVAVLVALASFAGWKWGGPAAHVNAALWRLWRGGPVVGRLRETNILLPFVALVAAWFAAFFVAGALGANLTVLLLAGAAIIGVGVVAFSAIAAGVGVVGVLIPGLGGPAVDPTTDPGDAVVLPTRRRFDAAGGVQCPFFGDGVAVETGRSVGVIGETGSGKTTSIQHLLAQLRFGPDEPIVAYDRKTDIRDFCTEHGIPYVRLAPTPSPGAADVATWNLFRELSDDDPEGDARELVRGLFPDPSGSGSGEFFSAAAIGVVTAAILVVRETFDEPDNHDLVSYLTASSPGDLEDDFTEFGHVSAASTLAGEGRMAASTYATVQQEVTKLFVGEFAASDGTFSVREYMASPEGRVLILDHPPSRTESTAPTFRALFDLAGRHALADETRGATFIADEFAMSMPRSRTLESLVNLGRGVGGVSVWLTAQSVSQISDTYGDDAADSLLAGLTTLICHSVTDKSSIELVKTATGKDWEEYTGHVERGHLPNGQSYIKGRETRREEIGQFSEGQISRWGPGEGVVVLPSGWVHVQVAPPPTEGARAM